MSYSPKPLAKDAPSSMTLASYSPLKKLHYENSFLVYTVLMVLLVVVALYWSTRDWKGLTTTEEVDLGEMSGPQHHRRRKHYNTARRRHYDYY